MSHSNSCAATGLQSRHFKFRFPGHFFDPSGTKSCKESKAWDVRSMDLPLLFRSSIPKIVIVTYMASDFSTYRTYLDIFSIPVRDLLRELLSLLLFRFGTLLQDTGRLSQDGSISNVPRYTGLCTGNKLCKVAMCCNSGRLRCSIVSPWARQEWT